MPPTFVYLEADDEITNAVARLRAAPTSQVVVALPPGSRIATSRINFLLLAREARELRRTLAIVSGDPAVRALALAAGLPAHASVSESERALAEGEKGFAAATAPSGRFGVPGSPERRPGPRDARIGPRGSPRGPAGTADTRVMPTPAPPDQQSGRDPRPAQEPLPWGTAAAGPSSRDAVRDTPRDAGRDPASRAAPLAQLGTAGSVAGEPAMGVSRAPLRGAEQGDVAEVRPVPRPRWRRLAVLAVVAALLMAGVGGAAAYLLNPVARITLTPRTERAGPITVRIRADPTATEADARAGMVPAERIEIPLSASDTFQATGVRVTLTKATGRVRFTSENTVEDVRIAAGTRLSTTTGGVEFTTTRDVVVPRASFGPPPTRGTADASIQAVEGGPSGNVPAGTIRRADPAVAARLISVDNPEPTTGGSRSETTLVSGEDVDEAVEALGRRLDEQMAARARDPANVPPGLTPFPETAQRTDGQLEPAREEIVGEEVRTFRLTLSATAHVLGVDESQLAEVAVARLQRELRAGHRLLEGSVVANVGKGKVVQQRVVYSVQARGEQWQQPDREELLEAIKGRKLGEARAILERYGTVDIELSPDVTGTLPDDEGRLELTLHAPQGTST